MLMLVLLRRFTESQIQVRAGKQIDFKNSCFENGLPELYGKRIGIIGLGAIGKELVKRLTPSAAVSAITTLYLLPTVWAPNMYPRKKFLNPAILSACMRRCSSTINMINDESLAMFKPGAILINTARGELIDQEALCRALESGSLGGFGADTLSPEPVRLDNPLLKLSPEAEKKVALTPHVAGITAESLMRMYSNIWRNIASVEDGKRPINIVNGLKY